jgi:hypothetical protein
MAYHRTYIELTARVSSIDKAPPPSEGTLIKQSPLLLPLLLLLLPLLRRYLIRVPSNLVGLNDALHCFGVVHDLGEDLLTRDGGLVDGNHIIEERRSRLGLPELVQNRPLPATRLDLQAQSRDGCQLLRTTHTRWINDADGFCEIKHGRLDEEFGIREARMGNE